MAQLSRGSLRGWFHLTALRGDLCFTLPSQFLYLFWILSSDIKAADINLQGQKVALMDPIKVIIDGSCLQLHHGLSKAPPLSNTGDNYYWLMQGWVWEAVNIPWLDVARGHALMSSTVADSSRGGQKVQPIAAERPEFKPRLGPPAELLTEQSRKQVSRPPGNFSFPIWEVGMPCCFMRVEGNGPCAVSWHMVGPQFGLLLPLKTGHTEMCRPTGPVESSSVLMLRSDFSSPDKGKETGTKEDERERRKGEHWGKSESKEGRNKRAQPRKNVRLLRRAWGLQLC